MLLNVSRAKQRAIESSLKKSINWNDQVCPGLPEGLGSIGQHGGAKTPCAQGPHCFSCVLDLEPAPLADPTLLTPVLWNHDKGILDLYRN